MPHYQKSNISKQAGEYGLNDMDRLLVRSEIALSPAQLEQLWTYHNLLRQYNARLNLTRIHNFANMVLKLYVDSILPGRLVDLPDSLLDLGTGPGMPGIPLKIAFPDLKITLAESRGKRVDFLKMAVDRLQIKDTVVVGKTITPAFETPVQGVITRAVEAISLTLDRVSGCLDSGGQVIFMKGPDCAIEIAEAKEKNKSRFRFLRQIDYEIPHTPHARRLVLFQRVDQPLHKKRQTAMNRHDSRSIESEQNTIFKDLKRLLSGRGIKKQGMALVSGSKQVEELLRDCPEQSRAWITAGDNLPPPEKTPAHVAWYQLSAPLFKKIDTIGTNAPLLMVETPEIRKWIPVDGLPPGCSVLVPFQDPENVGTIIRSAMAFGLDNIILLSESANPFHPKALRASGGAVLKANLLEGPALNDIPDNLPVMSLSREGKDISNTAFPDTFAFLPGMEGQGLPAHLKNRTVAIPISETVESLNAATAAAIAFYVWARAKGSRIQGV